MDDAGMRQKTVASKCTLWLNIPTTRIESCCHWRVYPKSTRSGSTSDFGHSKAQIPQLSKRTGHSPISPKPCSERNMDRLCLVWSSTSWGKVDTRKLLHISDVSNKRRSNRRRGRREYQKSSSHRASSIRG